ncbi:class I SAM-dependent methyltransferase [Sphaerisporangium rubeum]|uniref:2-polyprenyl-6-hydroxyphenyl methylase/3-demethylubiquinone-9 3-methyltransferase n=1 Tax=Sphaerisporangium rubeum TaxID=321317 RepID=A0A7X0M680_9ACTN|nr:2-polyprenyl-6-hydroxyphenyl methylase/3-demethylubiquinone-9 3-methyltransferase [Sphaerisporangium rubeum]
MAVDERRRSADERFAFGENWLRYLDVVDERRIADATASLTAALEAGDLAGRTFLDVGCGSGLFSLAAHRLGAKVHSFDYDPASVAACEELRRRFAPHGDWTIERGSILDDDHMRRLGRFDVVYSWGVLHHTGEMWRAVDAAARLVAPGGALYIAIYNDQGLPSRLWWKVKHRYVRSGPLARGALLLSGGTYFGARRLVGRLAGEGDGGSPRARVRRRGMSARHDLVDWIGGFPFEVATPEQVFGHLRGRGFQLTFLRTCKGRLGCNEYVFAAPGGD